ncbi:MAG TPA: hypothetical protein VFW76_04570, partial [Ktedonobacterales bacterium]|nr:hypothetical protein [Ktedonobacterales bacterium]
MNSVQTSESMHAASAMGRVTPATNAARVRLGAVSLVVAGILFVLYPAMRPFSDEGLSGSSSSDTLLRAATAFASPERVLAHMLGMLGFTLVGLGLLGLYMTLRETGSERLAFRTLVVGWLGISLTLPYYGGEAFGLHAIGREALKQHNAALVNLADVVRGGPQEVMFGVGLLLIAISSIMVALAIWRSGIMPRWSGVPFGLAFALYLPQFFGNQPIRVAHGVLVALGCLWIAVGMWRQS